MKLEDVKHLPRFEPRDFFDDNKYNLPFEKAEITYFNWKKKRFITAQGYPIAVFLPPVIPPKPDSEPRLYLGWDLDKTTKRAIDPELILLRLVEEYEPQGRIRAQLQLPYSNTLYLPYLPKKLGQI